MRNPLLPQLKLNLYGKKSKYKYKDAYRFITYRGSGKKETIWNGRDGDAPLIIYSRFGVQQLIRDKEPGKRVVNHTLKDGEYYFTNTTKKRARFLAKKIVAGRWENKRYPLYQQYGNKKEAVFLIYKSFYGDGNCFTTLKHGKNVTTYMTRQFKSFINGG